MSLQSTFESIGNTSEVNSPSSSQQQQLFVTTTRVKNQHLSLAQMRGVIQIFNHYFPKTPGKRMNREEKNRRWVSYKNRIYREYKRIITGKFSSEKALVKRYSEPLSFLKYKLKRNTNLRVSDLSKADQDYFHEIGGVDDINQLIKTTYNIDSVEKISSNFQHIPGSHKRRRLNDDSNHNRIENLNSETNMVDSEVHFIGAAGNHVDYPPVLQQAAKIKTDVDDEQIPPALNLLNDKLDIFEREQVDKKKIETFELTKQKLLAMKSAVEAQFINDPHLIGCLPGIEEQESLAFDCWINKYKHIILDDPAIKSSIDVFIQQVITLKAEVPEWNSFINKWKLNRILFKDDFHIIWQKVKQELNIQTDFHLDSTRHSNDKLELDESVDIIV